MRKIFTLLFASLIFSFYAGAQQVLFYNFENNLQEESGNGPELTVLGNQGIFEVVTLDEISQKTKTVYQGFGVFTIVALMLLAAKLFVGFEISYLMIVVVWLIPLWFVLWVVFITLTIALIVGAVRLLFKK